MSMTMQEKQQLMQELNAEIRQCTKCPLHRGRTHAVPGEGPLNAKVMFIGEGPGAMEDRTGRPFVGPAGQFLNELLALAGLKREEVFITNTVKCFISPHVLIYTVGGYKPIKDVQVGDLVLTHKGRFRQVVYVRPHETLPKGSEVVQLAARSLDGTNTHPLQVTVTPEHPFLVSGQWKPARAIQVGDRMRALGDRCEVCGRTYFVRYDRYECRTCRTCSPRCHNSRVDRHPETRGKARHTMRELVRAGEGKLQNLTSAERHRRRVALTADITKGLRGDNCIGCEEEAWEVILERLLKNHAGEYAFVDVEVIKVEHRQTRHTFPLYNIGVEEDESYVVFGLVSHNCRPPENRTPTTDEIAACNDYLVAQIALVQPKVICLLGSPALKTMLGAEYQISKVHGQAFEKEGMTFVPMFHPAAALHQDRYKMPLREDFVKLKGILARELSRET
ncbi:MAG: hypothetical protein NZT92_17930 [Abditibacteriales bacterium]|nr:hypothetical protein [Abditibacteriales bacterium]MDW8366023.1 uracil-DNA glycosylase family protein [Abditibacteriales bacterium]